LARRREVAAGECSSGGGSKLDEIRHSHMIALQP
jgi:hypothetical protein